MDLTENIALMKKYFNEHDCHMVVFIARDLPEIEELGLKDLVWAYHKEGCSRNEAKDLIDQLEKYQANKEEVK